MSTTVEVLREAREFMSDEANCARKGTFDEDGRYCLMAVFTRRNRAVAWDVRESAVHAVKRVLPYPAVTGFYDTPSTTHADVLAVLDRAVANETARAQEFTVTPEPARA